MFDDILKAADLYAAGLKNVEERKTQWLKKHKELVAHLKEIASYLNTKAAYKQGFFIDTLNAFNEDINGTCQEMPSVVFRSGDMPMLVTFRNSMGEKKEYIEEGFRLTFNPTITGEISVLIYPHQSELSKPDPEFTTLAIIKEPGNLTMEMVDKLVEGAIQASFYSSFTGIADTHQPDDHDRPNPIGFKRYDTTEKLN